MGTMFSYIFIMSIRHESIAIVIKVEMWLVLGIENEIIYIVDDQTSFHAL